ncbi:Vacuolar protein-sorting-associated protein 27 [Saitoella coloradoensis]
MASWFGSHPLDEQVERATSESLPAGTEDLALSLEICDQIRSKTVDSKTAMRSLKKRINHRNPNVQIAALKLTDVCVKNGGNHFLTEIASREFMDNLVSLLNASGGINPDVKSKVLECIQTWAIAFRGKSHLDYVQHTQSSLASTGFQFPSVTEITSSFVDTAAPPDWTDSDVCMRCRTAFTFTNRKHHCRNCGNVFCGACSSKTMALPHLGVTQAVRVCDGCYQKKQDTIKATPSKPQPAPSGPPRSLRSGGGHMQARSARVVNDDDDADFQTALKMSLEESRRGHSVSSGYVPNTGNSNSPFVPATNNPPASSASSVRSGYELPAPRKSLLQVAEADEEDPDLKAAIEASLREAQAQSARAAHVKQASAAQSAPAPQPQSQPPAHELTPTEAENITLFATLIDRLAASPNPATILSDPQISSLHDSISLLRPKLARAMGESVRKYETLVDMHAKLGTVVRLYDRTLEEQLRRAYERHSVSGYAQPAFGAAPTMSPQATGGYYGQSQAAPQVYPGMPDRQYSTGPAGYASPPSMDGQHDPYVPQGYGPPQVASPGPSGQAAYPPPMQPMYTGSSQHAVPSGQAPLQATHTGGSQRDFYPSPDSRHVGNGGYYQQMPAAPPLDGLAQQHSGYGNAPPGEDSQRAWQDQPLQRSGSYHAAQAPSAPQGAMGELNGLNNSAARLAGSEVVEYGGHQTWQQTKPASQPQEGSLIDL